jgi:hypothetical protein
LVVFRSEQLSVESGSTQWIKDLLLVFYQLQ